MGHVNLHQRHDRIPGFVEYSGDLPESVNTFVAAKQARVNDISRH